MAVREEKQNEAAELLMQALGRQSTFWGLGRTAGEMFAVLYLSAEPVSLEALAGRLGVTKGNVSIAIRRLEQLGMVHRSWQRGDRRVFFTAEADFWKIAHSVLSLRHRPEFAQSFGQVEQAVALVEQSPPCAGRDDALARLGALREFYRLLDTLVEAALSLTPEQLRTAAETFAVLAAGLAERRQRQTDR